MLISQLCGSARIIGIYGLAKNTGKTVALNALMRELAARGETLGVTSIGRDGEHFDVIQHAIVKPQITVQPGMLVATTHSLLSESNLAAALLANTEYRTPLGRIVVARMQSAGKIEIAGPNTGGEIREVAELMLARGASRVIVDGAINRRSVSSPAVTDAVIVATGAVLDEDLDRVIEHTVAAIERMSIPELADADIAARAQGCSGNFLLARERKVVDLPPAFALAERSVSLAALQGLHGRITHIVLDGAACDTFLQSVVESGIGPDVQVVVTDSTKLFLGRRSVQWYERQGVQLRVLRKTVLRSITVNPVAPLAHRFDSGQFRARLEAMVPSIQIRDVMHDSYSSYAAGAPRD